MPFDSTDDEANDTNDTSSKQSGGKRKQPKGDESDEGGSQAKKPRSADSAASDDEVEEGATAKDGESPSPRRAAPERLKWDQRLDQLRTFKEQHGRWPTNTEGTIGNWLKKQRARYAKQDAKFMDTLYPKVRRSLIHHVAACHNATSHPFFIATIRSVCSWRQWGCRCVGNV